MPVRIERRRNRRFVTRNTEYHLRGEICVAVRDRQSGAWLSEHNALGTRLLGSLARTTHGFALVAPGELGSSLWFNQKGLDVVTSSVMEVDRPPKGAILHYV
ncbi:MAG: hypothetical protein RBU45_10260 [Myxococcota bacterium]|jgi:hypothetical protein|nr:hypothetical protein [Myxococcota bacterium]